MEDVLHSGLAVSEKQVDSFTLEPGPPECLSHLLGDTEHVSACLWMEICKLRGMHVRDYEQVAWVNRLNVH